MYEDRVAKLASKTKLDSDRAGGNHMGNHLLNAAFALCVCSGALGAAGIPTKITFYKDVLPILQEHCQTWHRPGEVAPMSLLTFSDARPWARAIREAVLTKKMPPWFADPHYGSFYNDRTLSQGDVDTLVAWPTTDLPKVTLRTHLTHYPFQQVAGGLANRMWL